MDWRTTAPYFAAGVALLAGAVSALLSVLNTRETLRQQQHALDHQRQTLHEDRLWDKRAEVYVDVLDWAGAAVDNASRLMELSVDEREQSLVKYPVELAPELAAMTAAIAQFVVTIGVVAAGYSP